MEGMAKMNSRHERERERKGGSKFRGQKAKVKKEKR